MDEEKTIIFFDDSIDIGKEPLPVTDPELKKLHEKIFEELKEKYKVK